MAKKWSAAEESRHHRELVRLYSVQNKPIGEIGSLLGVTDKTIYSRLERLSIPTNKKGKGGYNNQGRVLKMPERGTELAEFFGIMLGDGNITHFQTSVTLGTKEIEYVSYVAAHMTKLFGTPANIIIRKHSNHRVVYVGSVQITRWLQNEGLVFNKVKAQVGVPSWIFEQKKYMEAFLRGFFDTDGSIYKLKYGMQISFTNYSAPLLLALQLMLRKLEYRVSEVSGPRLYITRRKDVERFFGEIQPKNTKHQTRYKHIHASVAELVNRTRL